MKELAEFHVDSRRQSSGGLYQLCYGEKVFESAIFLENFDAALEVCQMKSKSGSWIHKSLVRFLGTENHPVALGHCEKYRRLVELSMG